MATIFKYGSRRLKTLLVTVATTATLSTVSTLAPVAAQAEEPVNIQSLLSSKDASVADLAGAIATIEEQIAKLEGEIGMRREAVNRALVDLQDARTEAAQARRGTTAARGELDSAQSEVEKAQKKLNELSRTAYRRANTSDAVSTAAGNDARGDMLERQTYLHTQAKDQQAVLDRLERERTEKANKESQLRKTQELAQLREEKATEAEAQARQTLEESQSNVAEFSSERESLLKQRSQVQDALNQAKGLDTNESKAAEPGSNVKSNDLTKREAQTSGAATSQAPAAGSQESAVASTEQNASASNTANAAASTAAGATQSASESASANANANGGEAAAASGVSAAESSTSATESASMMQGGEPESVTRDFRADKSGSQLSASDVQKAAEAAQELSSDPNVQKLSSEGFSMQGSSVDSSTLALAGTAIGAAAAIVGAAQPNHTGLTQEELDSLAQGSSQLAALQGGTTSNTEDDELTGEVSDVLGELDTTDDVTEKATSALGDADRNAKIEAVIARAKSQIGMPYAWGGGNANGPTKGIRDGGVADSYGDYNKVGFDCSGLTMYAFAGVGISLPHYTGYQYQKGTQVPASEMQRGDLIFYGPGASQHVAIYLGDGTMIEAPQSGSNVQISPVRWSGMTPNVVRLL
ncbi:nlpC/P60 family protein [Corynebacterium simulans]|uniref:DIP1281 family NlpC/P60 protein n=1 Tax=Corynebacterium simulans TaxID=146827 RepID=UPI00078108F6|nr:NlpC/P60 family protein [Corynebacterium simulans]AMO87874.1 nlpC/P60 family protein [Corynebacterium simulans]